MFKKLLVIICASFFLVACGKKDDVPKIDIKGPEIGPDVTKVTPDYGPNDPVPMEDQAMPNGMQDEDQIEDPIE